MTRYDPAVHKWYEKYQQSTPYEVHLFQVGDLSAVWSLMLAFGRNMYLWRRICILLVMYIPKKLKLILKNTIIDKTLTYALETSTLTQRDRKRCGRTGTWRRKWERLKEGESHGKLPPRTCTGCSVPEPHWSHDWALVPANPDSKADY